MRRKMASHQRDGAVTVEFALTATILFTVIFGGIEFARFSILNHAADHASYVAAREAMIFGATVTDVKLAAQGHLDAFGIEGATVSVSPDPLTDAARLVEVVIDVPVASNAWTVPKIFKGSITGRTRMVAERNASDMNLAIDEAILLAQAAEAADSGDDGTGTP